MLLIKELELEKIKKEIKDDYQKLFQWCSSFHYSHSFLLPSSSCFKTIFVTMDCRGSSAQPLPKSSAEKTGGSLEDASQCLCLIEGPSSAAAFLHKEIRSQEYESMFSRGTVKSLKQPTLHYKEISNNPWTEGRVKPDD